jgi:hypothetical protein
VEGIAEPPHPPSAEGPTDHSEQRIGIHKDWSPGGVFSRRPATVKSHASRDVETCRDALLRRGTPRPSSISTSRAPTSSGRSGTRDRLRVPGREQTSGSATRRIPLYKEPFASASVHTKLAGGGGGVRTRVPERPSGSSTGVAGGSVSPRGSRRRRTSRPARLRFPAMATRRSRHREPAHDVRPAGAGVPRRTAA